MRRLFYSSDLDHRDLEAWGPLADKLRRAVAAACGGDVTVDVGDEPVWGPGADEDEILAELEEMRLHRRVRLDLWSAVVDHGAIAVTLGSEIKRPERRAIEKKMRKALRGEKLLRTVERPYSDESAWVFGFEMSVAEDDAARSALDLLLSPFDPPFFIGERWLVQGKDERLDEKSFRHITEVAPGLVTFFAPGDAAERAWRHASKGAGLIACYPDDPAIPSLVSRFHEVDDLRILLAEKPSSGAQVTIDRARSGENFLVAYTPAGPPEIEDPYLFLI